MPGTARGIPDGASGALWLRVFAAGSIGIVVGAAAGGRAWGRCVAAIGGGGAGNVGGEGKDCVGIG
eukprot:4220329-Prymnesium_polylepis.1